jgi:hypothetical protein
MLCRFVVEYDSPLFTLEDYKFLIKMVSQHFVSELEDKINVLWHDVFYNPEQHTGCVDFLSYSDDEVFIREFEYSIGEKMIRIKFV